jgi:hypothetical protein
MALVQHTWGLHELEMNKFSEGSDVTIHGETREHAKSLSYGPQFVYEEFVITDSVIGTLLFSLGFSIVNWLLFHVSPVSSPRNMGDIRVAANAVLLRKGSMVRQEIRFATRRRAVRGVRNFRFHVHIID